MIRAVAVLLMVLTGSCYVPQQGLEVYIRDGGEFWAAARVEKVEVVFVDKLRFVATSHNERCIDLPYAKFKNLVECSFRRRIRDIVRITHNHPPDGHPGITPTDREFLDAMRSDGFTGRFCIYHKGVIRDY